MGNVLRAAICGNSNRFRDYTPTDASTEAELDAWSDYVRAQVVRRGFEPVFLEKVHDIAEVADTHPQLAPAYIAKWMQADPEMAAAMAGYDPSELSKLDYKTGTRADGATDHDIVPSDPIDSVVERDGTPVKVYVGAEFNNWGSTVESTPSYTFVPKTEVGVQNIVKFARSQGKRVRCGGSRHSWSDVYGSDGDIFVSMMEPGAAVLSGRFDQPDPNPQNTELESVEFDGTFTEGGKEYGKVRLGGAATSDHFRKWAVSADGGNWQWMIHALPILVSITSAGWTQPICHGAGIDHQTVSDLCVEIRIINCLGEPQVITDKEQLKAVAGSFGMLGVITSHVFSMDPMKIAALSPRRVPAPLAVPPVSATDVPDEKIFDISKVPERVVREAKREFVADCKKFYSEWFWFPFQEDCWINTWDVEDVGTDRPIYPDENEVKLQNLQAAIARIFEVTFLKFIPAQLQARLLGSAAMAFLPVDEHKTPVTEAVHFRRGIHRMPVRDCEISIEIPLIDGEPDFEICQKAWWDAITEVYASLPKAPMRTAVEMRIIGGSEVSLASSKGNTATCAIEVLTNTLVSDEEWNDFVVRVVDKWGSLKDSEGNPLRFRPHWAKEWPLKVRNMDIMEYLKVEYKDDIPLFKTQMAAATEGVDYTLDDAFKMFGNDTMLDFLGVKP